MDISAISKHKKTIDETLVQYLVQKQKASLNVFEKELVDKLLSFVTAGKTIRGALTVFGYSMFSKEIPSAIWDIAAAFELFHSGFLIHDDIMDNDALRRGKEAIYAQYEKIGEQFGASDAKHFGVSMGINAADYCFFAAYELLERTGSMTSISCELRMVVSAQMHDVVASQVAKRLSEDEILSIYRAKTARYTFSLPLVIGAKLSNAPSDVVQRLDSIGEHIGIMFQIRDDELNILGNTKQTGKPIGSDIREHKQTLLSLYLTQDHPNISLDALSQDELTKLYIGSVAQKRVADKISVLSKSANSFIQTLPIADTHKTMLQALAEYVQTREN